MELHGTLRRLGLTALTLVATAAVLPSTASAGLIPGSGPAGAKADCYLELNVHGVDSPGPEVQGGRVVLCTEGDPCDVDGTCGNASCTFRVAVCIDQADPNLPTCHAPSHLQKAPHVNSKVAGAVPTSLEGSACGAFVDLALPIPSGKKSAMLRLSANATAPKGTNPRRDRDTFVLKCLPRTTSCPAAQSHERP